jgi:hypothetical protein
MRNIKTACTSVDCEIVEAALARDWDFLYDVVAFF